MKISRLVCFALLLASCGSRSSDKEDEDSSNATASDCRGLVLMVCNKCDVSQSFDDTVCECVTRGQVDNPQRYYSSRDEAEVACQATRMNLEAPYLTESELVQCRRDLVLLEDYGRDACDYLGYGDDRRDSGWESE